MTGIDLSDHGFVVDAARLAEALRMCAADVPSLMRDGAITLRCETGSQAKAGIRRGSHSTSSSNSTLPMAGRC